MIPVSTDDLAAAIGGRVLRATGGLIKAVSINSRTASYGDCFFAIRGPRFDGHNFVGQAYQRGAVCAVVERPIPGPPPDGCGLIEVADTVAALGRLARHYRMQQAFHVIAITGSVGKTTTRSLIAHIASHAFSVHQSPGNYNNQIGLPLSILEADPGCQVLVLELGTNRPGEIAYLSSIACPDVAVLTGVWPAHLEGLGDMEQLTNEKLSIARYLRPDGRFIVNADLPGLLERARLIHKDVTGFGLTDHADVRATDVRFGPEGTQFQVSGIPMTTPLLGPGNLTNTLAAIAACLAIGIDIRSIPDLLRTAPRLQMRAQTLEVGPITVINDCYNANPASMANALALIQILARPDQRRVFVCGDMAELGDQAILLHHQLGKQVAQAGIDILIAVGPLASVVAQAAVQAAGDIQTICTPSASEACKTVPELIKAGDILLIKGSRVAGLEMVLEAIKQRFGQTRT